MKSNPKRVILICATAALVGACGRPGGGQPTQLRTQIDSPLHVEAQPDPEATTTTAPAPQTTTTTTSAPIATMTSTTSAAPATTVVPLAAVPLAVAEEEPPTTTSTTAETGQRFGSSASAARGFRNPRNGSCMVGDAATSEEMGLVLDPSCMDAGGRVPASQWPSAKEDAAANQEDAAA